MNEERTEKMPLASMEERCKVYGEEIDRLRAELVRYEWIEKTSKDVVADNDRLRAENAEMQDALQMIVSSGSDEASRVFAAEVATRALLAKTIKELK